MNIQKIAKVFGVISLILGIGGILLGESSLFGLLNIEIVEDVIHVLSGIVLIYAGSLSDVNKTRSIVGALGWIYLVVAIVGFFISSHLFGLLPHDGYSIVDNIFHLVLALIYIIAARKA